MISFQLSSLSVRVSGVELGLLDEIKTLRGEQNSVSMMDQFARHSKLERKIIKAQEELRKHGGNKGNIHLTLIFN